jgi:hypothetical protein
MRFKGEPNLLVKFKKSIGTIKHIKFDNDGYFVTDNEYIIKRMKQYFASDDSLHTCKYCEESFDKKGDLLVHYRKHKEDK